MSLQEHSIVTDGEEGAYAPSIASNASVPDVSAASPMAEPRGKGAVEPQGKEVGMSNEVDPNRICCNGLFEAELVEGRVVLECLLCGRLWFRQADGTLAVDDSPRTPRSDI